MAFEAYNNSLEKVFTQNPVLTFEEVLGSSPIKVIDLIKLITEIRRQWEDYKNNNLPVMIIIDENNLANTNNYIDFKRNISDAIQNGFRSITYTLDINGNILNNLFSPDTLKRSSAISFSKRQNAIVLFLNITGVESIVKGISVQSENHFDSYYDMVRIKKLQSILEYRKLLKQFFETRVQYDPLKNYFAQKKDYSKDLHPILKSCPKLLKAKPEEKFQKELELFLKENCYDTVFIEARNYTEERYDVWVTTKDDLLYVLEIKWLGKSLTADGTIFDKYDNCNRAIEGAVQLNDYIDNSDKYAEYFGVYRIYCGVLVVFDARLKMDPIEFPPELIKPQIDLSQHFKMEPKKISASNLYSESNRISPSSTTTHR